MHGRYDAIARTKRRPRMISSCGAFAVRRYGTVRYCGLWVDYFIPVLYAFAAILI